MTTPADVIEEIIRNYGYQNIKPVAPVIKVAPVPFTPISKIKDTLKDMLAWKYAFSEVHTNIWYDTKTLKHLKLDVSSYATVQNPFNKDDNRIRSMMLPSMLTVASNNKLQPNVRVFEIGRVINENGCETENLAGVAVGMGYKALSEMITSIFAQVGLPVVFRLEQSKLGMWHPKNNAQILQGDKVVGTIGIIHPEVMSDAVGFELDLSAFDFQLISQGVAPVLSKFPKTELDFTFVWNGVFADLDAIWRKYHNPLVVKYCLSGVFENKFTLTFTLSSTEKTLDKSEINKIHQEILDFATQNSVHLG